MRSLAPAALTEDFTIRALHDAVWASARVAAFARRAGLGARAGGELAIVMSELVTNIAKYAGRGTCSLRVVADPYLAVELSVRDRGPGLRHPELAVQDGYSQGRHLGADDVPTRKSLGSGLAAVRRLSDSLSIECPAEGGTCITVLKRLRAR